MKSISMIKYAFFDQKAKLRLVYNMFRHRGNLALVCAIAWLALCVFIAIFTDLLSPYNYDTIDLRARILPPVFMGGSFSHPLGTDDLGRDVMSRLFFSIRVSILVALAGTIIGAVLGTTLGFIAAHFRGVVDDAISLLIDVQAALPFVMIALLITAIFGSSITLFIVVVGIYGWERYARLARGLALSAKQRGYVTAARAYNASPFLIYRKHIFPNVTSALIVNATLNFPETILLESGLSFLGLGIQPPLSSLGNMVGLGREYLLSAWWIAVIPGLVIVLTGLAVSVIGDYLRDHYDPTLTE